MSDLYSTSTWRLIPLLEASGAVQMAVDSWLLDQHVQGKQPSILRFYTWDTPTISLGYHQRQFPAHWNNLVWEGQKIDLVRRPTGGRAVLHQGDLTYAIITAAQKGVSRRSTYQHLCEFLIKGWQRLGVSLSFGAAGRGYIKNPNCFGTATAADLVTQDGYKLIGSAQVYREGRVLQHGSIRLRPNRELSEKVFGESLVLSAELESILSTHSIRSIANALTNAAGICYQASFTSTAVGDKEVQTATQSFRSLAEKPSATS